MSPDQRARRALDPLFGSSATPFTGGAYCANAGEPLVLTDPFALSPETAVYLGGLWHAGVLKTVQIFGGFGAVRPNVESGIAAL
jgi:hypothetical protein